MEDSCFNDSTPGQNFWPLVFLFKVPPPLLPRHASHKPLAWHGTGDLTLVGPQFKVIGTTIVAMANVCRSSTELCISSSSSSTAKAGYEPV